MHARHIVPCLIVAAFAALVVLSGAARSGTLVTLAAALACPLSMVSMVRAITGAEGQAQPATEVPVGDDYWD